MTTPVASSLLPVAGTARLLPEGAALSTLALRFSDAAPVQTPESLPEGFMLVLHLQDLPDDCHSCDCLLPCKIF